MSQSQPLSDSGRAAPLAFEAHVPWSKNRTGDLVPQVRPTTIKMRSAEVRMEELYSPDEEETHDRRRSKENLENRRSDSRFSTESGHVARRFYNENYVRHVFLEKSRRASGFHTRDYIGVVPIYLSSCTRQSCIKKLMQYIMLYIFLYHKFFFEKSKK